jgi:ubiquinone/menaquinone biosynthesis C-methylase UbiE
VALEDIKEMNEKPIAAGKSSFDLVDPEKVFAELRLQPETVFLDVACGVGNYTVAAAEFIGTGGAIHAVDLWEEGIAALRERIDQLALTQIHAEVGDVSRRLPVEDGSVDVVLMATVLHDLVADGTAVGTLREIVRVLRPQGRLVIIEFDKVQSEPGPPVAIRLSPGEVEEIIVPYGFCEEHIKVVGPTTYLISFKAV